MRWLPFLILAAVATGCGTIDDTKNALADAKRENERLATLQEERDRQDSADQRSVAAISAEGREQANDLAAADKSREREGTLRNAIRQQNATNARGAMSVLQVEDPAEQERRLGAVVEGERVVAQLGAGLEQQVAVTDAHLQSAQDRSARIVDEVQRIEARTPIRDEIARQARETASRSRDATTRASANVNVLSELAGAATDPLGALGRVLPFGSLVTDALGLRAKTATPAPAPAPATPAATKDDIVSAIRAAEADRQQQAAERERQRQQQQQQPKPDPQQPDRDSGLAWWLVGSNVASAGAGTFGGKLWGKRSAQGQTAAQQPSPPSPPQGGWPPSQAAQPAAPGYPYSPGWPPPPAWPPGAPPPVPQPQPADPAAVA